MRGDRTSELHLLARFVAQSTAFGLVLAAAEDVPDQPLPAEQALFCRREWIAAAAVEACLDQGEATADPVAVAAVNELVGAPGEAALGCVLP
jgi:hypothetical protein